MLTADYMNYVSWHMKDAYVDAVAEERKVHWCWAPLDFGAIDASPTIPAGSTYSHRTRQGEYFDMPSAALR